MKQPEQKLLGTQYQLSLKLGLDSFQALSGLVCTAFQVGANILWHACRGS